MSLAIVLGALVLFYGLGYLGWSRYLTYRVFGLSADEMPPAHDPSLRDDIDYMPVNKHVLWGHHYTSIAGAAPIIGPAVAIIWGWLPALLWIIVGTIMIGAVHDFGALVVSLRHRGQSISFVASDVIHPRVRLIFQLIIYFLIWIVLAVFSLAIGLLFDRYPASVIPINFEIVVAFAIGYLFHKKKMALLWPSIIALILLYAMVAVGIRFPVQLSDWIPSLLVQHSAVTTWALFLLVYAAVASVLPVWALLQPRDYINSHQLLLGLAGLILGLAWLRPEITAPMVQWHPQGAPPMFPMLFITIACGAISGFHGLVSSNTTSKQINASLDARPIGYGGMLGEGTLAVLATVAVAAGLQDWGHHYHSWNGSGVNAIANFVMGASTFLQPFGMAESWAQALVAVMVISFAATSMDTAARVQRLLVMEVGESWRVPLLTNRFWATVVAIVPAVPLVLAGQKAWGPLWLLFGTTNQLIGGITLLVICVYLIKSRRPALAYLVPMVIVLIITTVAMAMNLWEWIVQLSSGSSSWITVIVGAMIFVLELWVIVESLLVIRSVRKLS